MPKIKINPEPEPEDEDKDRDQGQDQGGAEINPAAAKNEQQPGNIKGMITPDFDPFDYVSGLVDDNERFSNVVLTLKKENKITGKFDFCKNWMNPKVDLNVIGRLFGGGRYEVILNCKDNGKKSLKRWLVPMNEQYWDRVLSGEITEEGQAAPGRPGSAPGAPGGPGGPGAGNLAAIVQETVTATITSLFNTLKEAGIIDSLAGRKGKADADEMKEILMKMVEVGEKRNTELTKILIANADARARATIDGITQGMSLNPFKNKPAASGDDGETIEGENPIMNLIGIVKQYGPAVMAALETPEQRQEILNLDAVKEAVSPQNREETFDTLSVEIGVEKAKELFSKLGIKL